MPTLCSTKSRLFSTASSTKNNFFGERIFFATLPAYFTRVFLRSDALPAKTKSAECRPARLQIPRRRLVVFEPFGIEPDYFESVFLVVSLFDYEVSVETLTVKLGENALHVERARSVVYA